MPRDLRAYLWDIQQASDEILLFTLNKTFEDYENERILQAAVEREFEIIGEALTQIAHLFPLDVVRITHYKRFIGFRNILIHRYSTIADEIVWGTIELDLPTLKSQVILLMERTDITTTSKNFGSQA